MLASAAGLDTSPSFDRSPIKQSGTLGFIMTRRLPDQSKASKATETTGKNDPPIGEFLREISGVEQPVIASSLTSPPPAAVIGGQSAPSGMQNASSDRRSKGNMKHPLPFRYEAQSVGDRGTTGSAPQIKDFDFFLQSCLEAAAGTLEEDGGDLESIVSTFSNLGSFVSKGMTQLLVEPQLLLQAHNDQVFPHATAEVREARQAEEGILKDLVCASESFITAFDAPRGTASSYEQEIVLLERAFDEAQEKWNTAHDKERQAWVQYLNISTTGQGTKDLKENFILKHEICGLGPSDDTDEVIDSMMDKLSDNPKAQIDISSLYSWNLDKNWEPLAESSAASYRSGHA